MYLRALHPDIDEHLYRQAWAWKRDYPKRVRQWDQLKHFRQWFKLQQRRVSVGVFDDTLIALVTLQLKGGDVYEVHVDCPRNVPRETLLVALLNLEQIVFEQWGAKEVFAGIISRNRGILRIAKECGFQRDGVSEQVGRLRWIRMRMTSDEFYAHKHEHRIDHEYVHTPARSRVA